MLDLTGKNALVTGIANNRSIAWGIAQQLHKAGANIGITYLPDEKGRAEKKVADLVESLQPSLFVPCNVQNDAQVDETFAIVKEKWGTLDILIHCLAFANKEDLTGDFVNTSREGFTTALGISAYSLIRLCAAAKPLMTEGGSIVTLTYIGGARVIPNYNVMGIAKAALEMNVRYLAADLGPHNIRVNAICPGLIDTAMQDRIWGHDRQAKHDFAANSPAGRLGTPEEVAASVLYLCSEAASFVTGHSLVVDGAYIAQ